MVGMGRFIVVRSRYTVTIPREIRRKVPVKEGDYMEIYVVDGKIVLEPIGYDPAERLSELIGRIGREELRHAAERSLEGEAVRSLSRRMGSG